MHNGHVYTPPPPKRRHEWLTALALIMACVGVLMVIMSIWTGLYYTLGGV